MKYGLGVQRMLSNRVGSLAKEIGKMMEMRELGMRFPKVGLCRIKRVRGESGGWHLKKVRRGVWVDSNIIESVGGDVGKGLGGVAGIVESVRTGGGLTEANMCVSPKTGRLIARRTLAKKVNIVGGTTAANGVAGADSRIALSDGAIAGWNVAMVAGRAVMNANGNMHPQRVARPRDGR